MVWSSRWLGGEDGDAWLAPQDFTHTRSERGEDVVDTLELEVDQVHLVRLVRLPVLIGFA
jgi:hypothetical protein